MQNKIILPYFTDEKYADSPLTLVECLSYLARRDGSHLILTANFDEIALFKYSKDFIFEKEIPVKEVHDGFKQFNHSHELSLSESATGQIIISGPANRCYIIDEDGVINPASYTATVVDLKSDAHALFPQKQEAAANNLYLSGSLMPQSDKLIALVDGEMGWAGSGGKKRGDFIVISQAPFADVAQRPALRLVAALNDYPDAQYKSDFPGIALKEGGTIQHNVKIADNLAAKIEKLTNTSFWKPWASHVYALTERLLLIPVFDRFRRLSTTTVFLLVDINGTIVTPLQDIKPEEYKLNKLEEFYFAINLEDSLIYYKAESTLFIFGFDGRCLDKIALEGALRPLAAFTLLGSTNNGHLLFYDKKSFNFLLVPQLTPLAKTNAVAIENAITAYKKYKNVKLKDPAKAKDTDSHIYLHKVDHPEVISRNYEWKGEKYDAYIDDAKQTFRFLFYVYRDSLDLLQMSVLQKTEPAPQKKWFKYGLICISEFCRLAHFPGEEKEAQIDSDGSFTIKVENVSYLTGVRTPLMLARIARDKEKEKHIAGFPEQLLQLERNLTFNHSYIHVLTMLEIEYSQTGNFNMDYYNRMLEIYDGRKYSIQAKISSDTNHTLYYIHPYVLAFKSLADGNQAEFNTNLLTALKAHKEVWGQKKALNRGGTPLCRENEGFLSWECTALAAMAFDKGWKIELEADYMPQFMVDGSINE